MNSARQRQMDLTAKESRLWLGDPVSRKVQAGSITEYSGSRLVSSALPAHRGVRDCHPKALAKAWVLRKAKMIPVTQELIEAGQSGAGGWNREQLEILGIPWPPRHGWRHRTHRYISEADAERFVNLKGQTKALKRREGDLANLLLNFDASDGGPRPL